MQTINIISLENLSDLFLGFNNSLSIIEIINIKAKYKNKFILEKVHIQKKENSKKHNSMNKTVI